ncbi:hypothetical protein ACP6PM_17660 [Dapis sp. BLCC M229]
MFDTETPEEQFYEELKPKFHLLCLHDQIEFLIKPELRKQFESYISQRTINTNYKTLELSNNRLKYDH